MEVKQGYKQTEVGIIPEDWGVLLLKECTSKITDGTHDTPKPVRSGIPFLTAIHVKDNWIDYEGCLYVTEEVHKTIYARCNPEQKDVLLVNIGAGVATTALVTVDYEFSLKNVALIKPDKKKSIGAYINYILSFRKPKIIQDLSSGGAQPFLSLTQIGNIVIPLPPTLAEQEAIAEALSDADALIEAVEQLLAKKRQVKQGAMSELLTGKRRLAGFGKNKYKQTEIGVVPEDWRVENIGQISIVGRGRVISHKEIAKSRAPLYPVYSSQTSDNGVMGYIDTFDFDGEYVTWTTDGANAGTVFHRNGKFNCTNVCGTIKLKSDNHLFVAKVLGGFASKYVSRHLGNPKIMNDVMKHVNIPLPSTLAEQTAIAEILSDMDAEIIALEEKLVKARQVKAGMMSELLTGKIRLV